MARHTSVLTKADIRSMEMDVVLSWLNERKCLVLRCRLLHLLMITIEIELFWAIIGMAQTTPEDILPHLTNQNNTSNCTDPKFWPCTFHLGSKGLNTQQNPLFLFSGDNCMPSAFLHHSWWVHKHSNLYYNLLGIFLSDTMIIFSMLLFDICEKCNILPPICKNYNTLPPFLFCSVILTISISMPTPS